MLGAQALEDRDLVGVADDVDERHAFGLAQPHQHLAEVRRRRRVNQGRVSFAAHGLDHAQRRQRIDERRGAVRRGGGRRQDQALGRTDLAELRVHGAAQDRDRLAE